MTKEKQIQIERLKALAQGRYGSALISWIEEVASSYADVRQIHPSVGFEARKDAVNIIENEFLRPLKAWVRDRESTTSVNDFE